MEQQKIDPRLKGFKGDFENKDFARIEKIVDSYEASIIKKINEDYNAHTTFGNKLADKIAFFGGSWKFIIIMASFLFVWILWNVQPFWGSHFDAKPFILLNLLLSFTAAFQAPIIMMSQNRQALRDKEESIIDFAINYRSEKEVADIKKQLGQMEKDISEIKHLLTNINEKQL